MESNQLEGLDRLMDAATILEGVPDELFNLKRWREKTDCGTVGCVAHHYAVARPESGLTLTATDSFGRIMPEFHGATAMQAMADLFNIERKEALHLFSRLEYPGHYSEPVYRQQVIDRIREFVAQKKRELEAACQDI